MAVSLYVYPNKVFLALGSNIGNWKVNFNSCLKQLKNIGELKSIGNIYVSKPYGYKDQNDFYNTAVEFHTTFGATKLIIELQLIEKNLHKNKLIKNGPRRIDIDIIFYNDSMETIMEKFKGSGAWNLPVIKNQKYLGFISKSKLLTAYRNKLIELTNS